MSNLNAAFGVNPRFHRAMMKLHAGGSEADLDEDEVSLADSFIISVVQIYEQLYHETRQGVLDIESLDEFTGQSVFSLPYFKEKWPLYRVIFSKPIVEHIEAKYGPLGSHAQRPSVYS